MPSIENALYTDPRLVAVYDLFNAGDHDFTFYAARIDDAQWFGGWHGAPFDAASSAEIITICRA
jgi:hypothetical protein